MIKKTSRTEIREQKHRRLRGHLSGTAECPRLCVFRSNQHIYAQIVDDVAGKTLAAANTLQADVKDGLQYTDNVEAAAKVGKVIGEKAVAAGIKEVVFDRGGFLYTGKIRALADAAREAGLDF
jgi:large subunit ribosomal protein L18